MPTTTQPSMTRLNVREAWYEAVFASALQPIGHPNRRLVRRPDALGAPAAMRRESDDERYL
jgi:hypothetical protein